MNAENADCSRPSPCHAYFPTESAERGLGALERERSANSRMLRDYPGHESLWCYRRFVCQAFLAIAPRRALTGPFGGVTVTGDAVAAAVGLRNDVAEGTTPHGDAADLVAATRLKDEGGLDNGRSTEGGGKAGGGGGGEEGRDASQGQGTVLLPGAAIGGIDQHSATAAAGRSRGGYDWAGWDRAVTAWHEGCVLEDAKAAAALENSSDDEEEEEEETGGLSGGNVRDGRAGAAFEEAEGALPGAPAGGGLLAQFLGQEARFAIKCATDKVGCCFTDGADTG